MKRLPMVDLKKLHEIEELNKLREACEKYGCFRIMNHNVPITLMADMKSVAKYLHELPIEIKKRNTSIIPDSGFVKLPTSPLYEGLGIYDMHITPQALHDFCSHLELTTHHRQIIEAYGQAIHELASSISQKMAECVGIVGADFKDWPFIFRIIKYNFSQENIGTLGVQPHSDTGFITLLQDDEKVGGLELMDDSGSYVSVPAKSGTFLCIVGDVGHAWSNGRFHNVKHRVLCKEVNTRFSFGAFILASRNGSVDAPKELVDNEHPRLYHPFNYEDLRLFRISTGNRTGEVLDQFRITF
ncbi:hypothetical protein Lal_00014326 [Lupinus albus]|uniref:2-oxoglutarate-dependent dioxygenase DAO n=1 Tax=Lupinus albus TaxID=3870 RepID=A0A6A4NGF5_LUPAL|nr:putative flavanone 3-dioxygenase [Lupinus albus]KAF1858571.1 hypothetical protein Lal_00014326 [Lupinus albus]